MALQTGADAGSTVGLRLQMWSLGGFQKPELHPDLLLVPGCVGHSARRDSGDGSSIRKHSDLTSADYVSMATVVVVKDGNWVEVGRGQWRPCDNDPAKTEMEGQ